MKFSYLLVLASLAVNNFALTPEEERVSDCSHAEERAAGEEPRREAESLLLGSMLIKINGAQERINELSKRQRAGKGHQEDLQQWLDSRERAEEEQVDCQKRQHPGKRDSYVARDKKQHPGRRSYREQSTDDSGLQWVFSREVSKRQHPGKRYAVHFRRQYPDGREQEEDVDGGDLRDQYMGRHPGKEYWDDDNRP